MIKRAEQRVLFGKPELVEYEDGSKIWEGIIYIEQNNKPKNPIKYIPPIKNHEKKDSTWVLKSMFYSFADTARMLSTPGATIILLFPDQETIDAIKEDEFIVQETTRKMAGLVYEFHSYEKNEEGDEE